MEGQIARLEAVASRLEALAVGGKASGAPAPAPGAGTGGVEAAFVKEFDNVLADFVAPFVAAANAVGGDVQAQAKAFEAVFNKTRAFLVVAGQSAKPSDADLPKLLAPVSEAMNACMGIGQKSKERKSNNHFKAIEEGIPALGWISVPNTPAPYVTGFKEASEFWSNRVLKEFKGKDDNQVKWVTTLKAIFPALFQYVKQHHTTGVSWKVGGGNALENMNKAGGAAPVPKAGGPPPPPPGPPPPPPVIAPAPAGGSGAAGGHADLLNALNRGSDITKGLKKVDKSQMTHKNPELRQSSVVPDKSAKAKSGASTASKALTSKKVLPPKKCKDGDVYLFENLNGDKDCVVSDARQKEKVMIYKCENCMFKIDNKVNSISLSNCKKVALVFEEVIATVEISNSKSVQVQVLNKAPTIAIDQVDGCQVFLSKNSLETEIVSAKSSEMNINVPGATENDDPKEHAVPEQFKTVYNAQTKKFDTEILSHG